MKLSEQVCTLEQAKKIYALGVERRSLFYHFHGRIEHEAFGSEYYSAFTVAELGVMLPPFTYSWMGRANTYGCVSSNQEPNDDYINYSVENGQISNGANEAECRAAQLIYLLENNHVTPAEINQRLTQK